MIPIWIWCVYIFGVVITMISAAGSVNDLKSEMYAQNRTRVNRGFIAIAYGVFWPLVFFAIGVSEVGRWTLLPERKKDS